jgi:hypothetical protein
MAKRSPRKKRSPVGGGEEDAGGAKSPRSQPNGDKQSSYMRSRQLLKDLEESLLGWMARNARSESEKGIYRFRQNLKQYLQEKSIPSEHLPAAFRDDESFNECANFFAVSQIAQYLMECLIQGARDPNIRHTEASEALYIIAFDACAALRDIITKHSGTDAQRQRLADIAKHNCAFPLLFRGHTKANKDAMQALERMGLGERSWIATDASKKYGVDSELNRYLIRVIPHVQRFCEIDLQGSITQNSLLALPTFEHCRNPQQAQKAFDKARKLFLTTGKPVKRAALEWAKRVFAPLMEAGYGDPYDIPSVPEIPEAKLFGAGGGDKSSRSPRERLVHYVFMALKGMLGDRQNDTKQVN